MKKGLLFLFALTLGVTTSQAQLSKAVKLSKASTPQKMQKVNFSKESYAPLIQKSSRRAAGDVSLMYRYPMGALYYGLTDDGSRYARVQMVTGAFDDTEFTNWSVIEKADGSMDKLVDVTWDWGTSSETGEAITPFAQRTDEDGSMIAQAFGSMKFPSVKYGDQSFEYTITDIDDPTVTYPSFWTAGTEGIADFTFYDSNGQSEVHQGTVGNYIPGFGLYSGFGGDYGFISNKTFYNLENYQTTKQWNNTGKKTIGFAEYYVKPVSHVYAESVVAWYWFEGVTDKTKPLGGKTITATICTFGEDNKLKEYATATATDADVVIVSSKNSFCYIEFKFSESDPILGEVDAPIVLPNEDFIVMLTGFGDVTGNFTAPIVSADGFTGFAYAILEDESISTIGYTNDPETPQVSLPIGFRAALPVATYAEINLPAVLFTDEGGVGAGIEGNDGLYGFSLIYTMSGKDQWEIVEKPDWISTIELDDESVAERGNMFVTLEAEALPSGTDERSGKVVLELYGKQLEIPVYQNPNGNTITLSVTDDKGQDITEGISIVWYDGEGKQIGTGNKLNGVAEGAEVYYSVLLDESLGRIYREVNMQKAEITEDEIILTCQLEKIGRVTLEGYVSATDIDKTTVTVSVRQMLNGKWQQDYSTQTDAQGKFSVEVYDDVTDITISGDGYLNTTIHRDGFGGNGNVGTIPVSRLTGFAIAANITIAKATTTGEPSEATAWTDGLTNIGFSLTNMTKGTALTDIAVQNGNVVIKSGAAVGDEISLTAVSKQGVFADATTTFTIAESANRFDLELTELGGIEATCEASSNSTTVGYLYDHNDVLAARGSYKGETLSLRHLKSGTYTLVTMGQSLLLGNLTSLNDLNAVGLSEGADYVTTRIEVADGELTAVSVSEVPRMNDAPFYYTTGNTYFNAGKTSVTAGNYLTLLAHVDFKAEHADKANGVTLTIDLPEGCQMVDNSVIANRKAVAHTVNGNRVTIPLTKEQYESEVRFCVIPTLNQSYTVTAMASFDIGGQVQQPIGTAQFEAKGLSISVPKITESTLVTINGTAKGHSEVRIYDNDVFIGKTSSKADGRWTAQCELHKPYSHSFHDIYAKITTESGMELSSETQQVEYIKINIVPTTVTMLYYNPEFVRQYNIVFDLINGTTAPSSYYYFPYKNWPNWYETRETEPKDFTFLADFTRNDPTQITNVNIKVLNSDGTVRTLPATFDGKQGKWVATTQYASASRLPQNVTVEYDLLNTATEDDREEPMLDMATDIIAIANKMNESIQDNVALSLLEEEESKVVFEYKIKDFDDPMLYELEILDFATAKKMLDEHQFIFSETDGDTIAVFTDYTNSSISTVNINMTEKIAFRTILYDNEANQQAIPARKASKVDMLRSLLLNPLNISKLTNFGGMLTDLLGIREYLSVGGDFKMMCQVIIQYQEKYSKTHQNAFNLLLSKCPDGSKKLSEEQIEKFNAALNALSDTESAFADQYYVYLQEYKKKLAASVLTFGLTSTLLQFVKVSKMFRYSKFNQVFLKNNFNKFMFYNASRKTVAEIFGNTLGIGINAATNIINNYKDFNSVRDNTLSWAMDEDNKIMSDYVELINAIKESYKDCNKKEDEETNDEPTDDKSDFNGNGTRPIIDPSGYVYEAVLSNRLEGVTTTCYEQQGGSAVLWNAADYSQQNPLQTDETGFYRWDVPQGMWQVKYEKEGYETAYSEWLPVPPPQLDVNIGMKQNTPPTVKQMRGHESGITVEMGKYVRPETMTAQNITVTRNGTAESGSIELLNTEQAPLGDETYVSKVKFVPESGFNSTDVVVVTVHKEVESYCGVQMTGDHVETVKIEAEVKDIVADSAVTVPYQGERELRVVVMPKGAAAGRKLHVKTSSAMIAAVSAEEVTIDQDGVATLTVGGELPGGAVIDFSLDGTDITATSKVKVVMNREMVAMPVASIMSGSTIDGGTQIVLTCDTEGATIYYTLDGSCPCDEATRHKYDGPIAIATDVIVKAIAVKEGMDDSDIATFIYVVTGINGAQDSKDIDVKWFDGSLIVDGAEGSGCQIYDLQGRTLASRTWLGKHAVIAVPRADVYVVSIQSADKTQTVIRKIMAR